MVPPPLPIPSTRCSGSSLPAGRRRASTVTIPLPLPRLSMPHWNPTGHRSLPAARRSASARRRRAGPRNLTAPRSARMRSPRRAHGWAGARGRPARLAWAERLAALDADKRAEFERRTHGELPSLLAAAVRDVKEKLSASPKEIAARVSSEMALDALTVALPEMVGGSADLTGSNNTRPKAMKVLSAGDYAGRFIHYGVREHGMAAAM